MPEKNMAGRFLIANQYHEAGNVKTQTLPYLDCEQSPFNNGYLVLNDTMQLVWDKKQWIIQILAGNRLRNKYFCATRSGLLRVLGSRYPNQITDNAVSLINQFPEKFSDWRK